MAFYDLCSRVHQSIHNDYCPKCGTYIQNGSIVFGKLRVGGVEFEIDSLTGAISHSSEIETNRSTIRTETIDINLEGNSLTINDTNFGAVNRGDCVLIKNGQVFINLVERGLISGRGLNGTSIVSPMDD